MGHHRNRKKPGRSAWTDGKTPDELAASSMSSESTRESIVLKEEAAVVERSGTCARESVEPPQLLFSWKEVLTLGVILLAFAVASIILGVAAGVSISIHYYESPENVDYRRWSQPAWDEGRTHVTRLDPTIAASSGVRSALHWVEESPSLAKDRALLLRTPSNVTLGMASDDDDDDDDGIWNYAAEERLRPPNLQWDDWLLHPPKLCPDGTTRGYDSWHTLRLALEDANRFSAHRYEQWQLYFAARAALDRRDRVSSSSTFPLTPQRPVLDDDTLYYEEELVFTICPGVTVFAQREPLVLDTESLTLECDGCTLVGGHLSFGPDAKNTLIRGLRFVVSSSSSSSSSLWFPAAGASVVVEDCVWVLSSPRAASWPAIVQVNSSRSTVQFYRCRMEPTPRRRWWWLSRWPGDPS